MINISQYKPSKNRKRPVISIFARKKSVISIFKSKPKLAELIPDGYVDIHSHVLFGVDDGAQNIEETAFLLQSIIDLKFSKCIATPHTMKHVWDNTNESIITQLNETKKVLPELTTQLELKAASEYLMDDSFMHLFKSTPLLTLKDQYVLVEMSYLNPPIQLHDIIFELQLAGYTPILAHPERYTFYHHDFEQYQKLKKAGCLFQLNLLSTVGYYGKPVADTAQKLLKNKMIDFTGSDIHHKNHVNAFYKEIKIKESEILVEAMKNNFLFQ